MIAYIIFKNDEPMKVVLNDSEKAMKVMDVLSNEDYARHQTLHISKDEFKIQCYWHIYEVEVVD